MNSHHTNSMLKQSYTNNAPPTSPPNRNSNIDMVNVNIAKPTEEPKLSAIAQMMKDQDDL